MVQPVTFELMPQEGLQNFKKEIGTTKLQPLITHIVETKSGISIDIQPFLHVTDKFT